MVQGCKCKDVKWSLERKIETHKEAECKHEVCLQTLVISW